MARAAQGWRFRGQDPRTGHFIIRFTHNGTRYTKSTGTSSAGEASKKAREIYQEVVSGQALKRGAARAPSGAPFKEIAAEWLGSVEHSVDPKTYDLWECYVTAHWIPFFKTVDAVTEAGANDYWRRRLGCVQVSTVRHELSALRGFIRWCHEHGYVAELPPIKGPGKKAVGTVKLQRHPIALTEEQVEAIIAHLPEHSRSRKHKGKPFWVKARFEFAWETGMRPEMIDALSVPDNYKVGARHVTILVGIDKNRMPRPLPISRRARAALDCACPTSGLIFGAHDFRAVLRKAATEAGFDKDIVRRVTEQCFRHSRITYWADTRGDNLTGIQYMAGHTKASTTEKYIKASLRAAEGLLEEEPSRVPSKRLRG